MAENSNRKPNPILEGSTLGVGIALALVLFFMVNYLAGRHYARFDWTGSQLYSLSEKSENVLESLEQDVELVLFITPESPVYPLADEMLSRYEAANPAQVKKRVIDPVKNRLEAERLLERFSVERSDVIVVASGEDRRVIDRADLVEMDFSGAQFGQEPVIRDFKGEQLITSAILELVEAEKPKIVFTTGHGETSFEGAGGERSLSIARRLLGSDNFTFEAWNSATAEAVPDDADLIVVAGPQTSFFEPELELLGDYLDGGGRMLVLLDPMGPLGGEDLAVDPALAAWLEERGVLAGGDVVLDPASQMPLMGPGDIIPASYGPHPIVEVLDLARAAVHFSLSRSVRRDAAAPAEVRVTELLRTSAEAWGETDIDDPDLGPDDGEVQGPVALGVAVSFDVEDAIDFEEAIDTMDGEATDEGEAARSEPEEARLVVFGDVDFATDLLIQSAANRDLVLNAFNWLVEREQLIAIPPKSSEETRLFLTNPELTTIWVMVLGVLPGMAVFFGVWIHLRRRR